MDIITTKIQRGIVFVFITSTIILLVSNFNNRYNNIVSVRLRQLTPVVTVSDEKYYPRLRNLVGSIHQHEPLMNIIVYDLGLSPETRKIVETWCRVEVRTFKFEDHPSFFRDKKTFAWKPLLIDEALDSSQKILYLDSSVELRAPIGEILLAIQRDGYWFTTTGWKFPNWLTYPLVYQYFNLTENDFDGQDFEVNAAMMGFTRGDTYVDKLVNDWVGCANVLECIAPPPSNLSNHRQDQTAINFLVYKPVDGFKYTFTPPLSFNMHNDWKFFAYEEKPKTPLIIYHRRDSGPYASKILKCK